MTAEPEVATPSTGRRRRAPASTCTVARQLHLHQRCVPHRAPALPAPGPLAAAAMVAMVAAATVACLPAGAAGTGGATTPARAAAAQQRGAGAAATSAPAPTSAIAPPSAASAAALLQAQLDNQQAQARYYTAQAEKKPTDPVSPLVQTLLGGGLAIVGGAFSAWLTHRIAQAKERRAEQRMHQRQKGQLRLSATDLLAVLLPIGTDGPPPAYLSEALVYEKFTRPAKPDRSDPYYLKYDLVDTVYRFCALLGWLELYRTEPTFLRGPADEQQRLENSFGVIRQALAGPMDDAKRKQPAVTDWRDGFILEDDQRAIGEKMLAKPGDDAPVAVIGYAAFCEQLFRDPSAADPTDGQDPHSQNWWIWNATRFFVDIGAEADGTDLRRLRVARVAAELDRILRVLR